MKKFIIVLLSIVFFSSATAFILIPKELTVSEAVMMNANENAVFRYLSNKEKWAKWWPKGTEKTPGEKDGYTYNGFTYHLKTVLYNAVEIDLNDDNSIFTGNVNLIRLPSDSIMVRCIINLKTSSNPVKRFFQYQQAKKIKNNVSLVLNNLKSFIEDKGKVYAFNIHPTTLKDSFFVAIKTVTPNYPSTKFIYNQIERLRSYLIAQRAHEADVPILNITKRDSLHYEMMVAIATDKILNGGGDISFKRMIIYKDKILTAEVKGGPENIKKAYDELATYMSDYNLVSPVIPWESLITDRLRETDSTKWITKINIPIV